MTSTRPVTKSAERWRPRRLKASERQKPAFPGGTPDGLSRRGRQRSDPVPTLSLVLMAPVRTALSALIAFAVLGAAAQDSALVLQSGPAQTTLLELFTSEGCNSCPPAERWLTSLKASPGLWKDFVPVAFHVDYWDRAGWRDPWSARAFSDRQRAYAAAWNNKTVYTPGFVLDGTECRDWPQPKQWPPAPGTNTGVLRITSADRSNWQVRFTPAGRDAGWYVAHAALLANGLTSDVKAGENRGRRLTHDFVVTALKDAPLKYDPQALWGQFVLNGAAKGQTGQLAVAVWVTRSGNPKPLQAVGGWLR
jgi:hypothetical protein